MRYGSVCSGVEAATLAWEPMGWKAQWFSEIEAFPSAVLAQRWPEVPNLGDMTKYKEWTDVGAIDLLVGGTPCQSFSVAGLRKGLDDPRGNLALVYLAIAEQFRPRWLVWENVPGVLSSNNGRDFGAFLGALGELGYGWSYRVLDAQYFGVAQRRRRVFVVASLAGWAAAAAVLFEPDSLSGNPPPSRKTREEASSNAGCGFETAGTLDARTQGGGFPGSDGACQGHPPTIAGLKVRRLMPVECERLQGMPDGHTAINYRSKPAADGPRYKAIGNSMAVPVMAWIGKRIAQVDAIVFGETA